MHGILKKLKANHTNSHNSIFCADLLCINHEADTIKNMQLSLSST